MFSMFTMRENIDNTFNKKIVATNKSVLRLLTHNAGPRVCIQYVYDVLCTLFLYRIPVHPVHGSGKFEK